MFGRQRWFQFSEWFWLRHADSLPEVFECCVWAGLFLSSNWFSQWIDSDLYANVTQMTFRLLTEWTFIDPRPVPIQLKTIPNPIPDQHATKNRNSPRKLRQTAIAINVLTRHQIESLKMPPINFENQTARTFGLIGDPPPKISWKYFQTFLKTTRMINIQKCWAQHQLDRCFHSFGSNELIWFSILTHFQSSCWTAPMICLPIEFEIQN